MFLANPCGEWKTLFFIKVYGNSKILLNRQLFAFIRTSVLKEVRVLRYLQNNSLI